MDTEPREIRELVADQVRRFRAGDGDAAEPLARRALCMSLRTASALMRSREDAAGVAQEVAVDVLGSLERPTPSILRDQGASTGLEPPIPCPILVRNPKVYLFCIVRSLSYLEVILTALSISNRSSRLGGVPDSLGLVAGVGS